MKSKSTPTRSTGTLYNRLRGTGTATPHELRSGLPLVFQGNFNRSLTMGYQKIPVEKLRAIAKSPPAYRAIQRCIRGVLSLEWTIKPPQEKQTDKEAIEFAKTIKNTLKRPNRDSEDTYSKFVSALIQDILVVGYAAVERQPGTKDTQPFWAWVVDPGTIMVNTETWRPDVAGVVPRYYQSIGNNYQQEFLDKDLYLIYPFSASDGLPPSPLEVAYQMIESWLGLSEFQWSTTTRAIREYLLVLKEVKNKADLEKFREYWRNDVEGKGQIPILNGEIDVIKLGARNDGELYLEYCQYILKIIALVFGLSPRDMNLTDHDNRATANVAKDATTQDAILPLAECICEHNNLHLIEFFGAEGYFQTYDNTEPHSQAEESRIVKDLFQANIIYKDEARIRVGEEELGPDKGGHKFADGSTLEPNQDPNAMGGQPGMPPNQPPNPAETAPNNLPPNPADANTALPGAAPNNAVSNNAAPQVSSRSLESLFAPEPDNSIEALFASGQINDRQLIEQAYTLMEQAQAMMQQAQLLIDRSNSASRARTELILPSSVKPITKR